MSFSFRSMFQGGADPGQQAAVATMASMPLTEAPPPLPGSQPHSMTASAPPLNAASPFGAPLFKLATGESTGALPVQQQSPFSSVSSVNTGTPLTVGDVLPQLPPDLARAGALPPEQPVAVSPQALEEALRGGQAALPIFEIYRVCPALFQTPVSPHDPRMIPLPASKLARLIAATQPGPASFNAAPLNASAPASPFGMAPGGMIMAEQPAQPEPSPFGTALPPKRQGPPPPLADVSARESAPQLSLPGQPPASGAPFPMTPFAAAGAEMSSPPPPAVSPFSVMPQAVPAPAFAPVPEPAPSAASPFMVAPSASPFSAAPPASQPLPSAGTDSPFGTLFGSKAVPTGQPAPNAPASFSVSQPAMPAASQPLMPQMQSPMSSGGAMGSQPVRLSMAGLLKGYTAAELGFDPMIVPTWITTVMQAQRVQELLRTPVPVTELGLLIDGITDMGFRNVLNTAKRDFQLRLPVDELQSALAGAAAPPTLPNLASLGTPQSAAILPAAPSASGIMRIEPPGPTVAAPKTAQTSPFASAAPAETAAVPGLNSPFLAPSMSRPEAAATSATFAPATAFGSMPTFQTSSAQPQQASPFAAPAAAPSTPVAEPSAFAAPSQQPIPFIMPTAAAPVARAQDPFAAPAQPPMQPPAQPQASFNTPFQSAAFAPVQPAPAAPMVETTVLPPERPQEPASPPAYSFTPPAAVPDEGFSSEQLLGGQMPPSHAAWNQAAVAAATAPFEPPASRERTWQPPVFEPPSAPEQDDYSREEAAARAPLRNSFIPPAREEIPAPPTRGNSAASIKAPRAAASRNAAPSSSLGVQMHDTDPDQILLRALLDTDSDLSAQRVVEMTCALPGIAACVCIQGDQAISHIGAHKPQAREFQRQATDLAQHLRTLAPLIGIEGAETFTMNSGDRLMTFCFPEGAILGVLHDAEPTLGLRDKITLIARELSRMIA